MTRRIRKALAHVDRLPEIWWSRRVTSQWTELASAYIGLSRLAYPYDVRLLNGFTIRFNDFYDVTTFWQIFVRQTYAVNPEDRVILDAGANIGSFALYALSTAPQARVIAIEPFPSTFERLRELLESSAGDRCVAVNCALRGHPGVVIMDPPEVPTQMRRVLSGQHERGTSVHARTLESVLEEHSIDWLDFMKMDVEGSEYDILLGSPAETLRRIGRISLEYHPLPPNEPYTKDQLFTHLYNCGFRLVAEEQHSFGYGIAHFSQASRS